MTTDISLLSITDGRRDDDGRPLIRGALESVLPMDLPPMFRSVVVVNDCPDPTFATDVDHVLAELAESREVVIAHLGVADSRTGEKQGFAGAVQAGWHILRTLDQRRRLGRYVVHLEDDFRVDDPRDFLLGRELLERHRDLAQVALLRNPVSAAEHRAGSLYHARAAGRVGAWVEVYEAESGPFRALWWIRHREFFTTNPCIYRAELMDFGWPDAPRSEEKFGDLCRQYRLDSAYLGRLTDPPRCQHVARRSLTGRGY